MPAVIDSRIQRPPSRGMRRERLDVLLSQILDRRLTVVTAPAGSGKSTALAHFCDATEATVAWYTVDTFDARREVFLACLQAALERVLDGPDTGTWTTHDDVIRALETAPDREIVIVIDDLHTISGQPAESLLGELVAGLPSHVHMAIASRREPHFDTSRWQLSGEVREITSNDLRFRTWEAEELLDTTYGLLLRPDDVARLTRRVDGWAAGFQLFHLAVRDKPPPEQRRLIDSASSRSTLARRYLARNVLAGLTEELRHFLLHSSILGVLDGGLADAFLERSGSAAVLDDLDELGLFVIRLDETTFRYHEVLRSHLEAELATQTTEFELHERFVRAGDLLDGAGHPGEALRCYARAGRWDDVSRLAGRASGERFGGTHGWLDTLTGPQIDTDPWIALALARAELAAGRFHRARDHFATAESLSNDPGLGVECRRERLALESFLDPIATDPDGWLGTLRRGLRSDPVGAAAQLGASNTPQGSVAAGILHLLTGRLHEAAASFDGALLHEQLPDWAIHAGRLGRQATRLLDGPPDAGATIAVIDRLVGSLESAWLARFARAMLAITMVADGDAEAARVADRCHEEGDPWGAAFARLCAGVAADDDRTASDHFAAALEIAERHQTLALVAAAHAGLAQAGGSPAGEHREYADRLMRRLGLRGTFVDLVRTLRPQHDRSAPDHDAAVSIRCLGDFAVGRPGEEADLKALRPRARAVLQRLALESGRVVHRDRLVADLWTDQDEGAAVRSLQVCISSIRRALDDAGSPIRIEHADGGYVLDDPSGGRCDLVELESALRAAESASSVTELVAAADEALRRFGGELLPGVGAVDWVVGERERLRLAVARAACVAATAALPTDVAAAIDLADRGLEVDRFDDALWRLAIDAHAARGDSGAVERLRRSYDAALRELGVEPSPVGTS